MLRPHAFVAMPFGTRPGPDGKTLIDFNRVWDKLLRPALEMAGFEAFRADQDQRAGDIRVDMFQELLVADLVLADLTLPNPNVWYELGVRHALRARGVVLVYGAMSGVDASKAFDLYTDRKLRYELTADGQLDDVGLADAVQNLTRMLEETRNSSSRRKVSPVYQLLPHLEQPQWKALLMSQTNEVSDAYNTWIKHLTTARRNRRPGDVMTLAGESPVRALGLEAYCAAGNALLALEQPALALEQFDLALTIDPQDLAARQKRLVCLGRLDRLEEARGEAEALTREYPTDAESWALLGRLEKIRWCNAWSPISDGLNDPQPPAPATLTTPLRVTAKQEQVLLDRAIAAYRRGFLVDPRSFYAGINTLTLLRLYQHLGDTVDPVELSTLVGAICWAVESALRQRPDDYWALASRAELALLQPDVLVARRLWQQAVAAADRDWFALDSSRQTLALLQQLDFYPEVTATCMDVLERELERCTPPLRPRLVFLFSGHMMDRPDRSPPRFPPGMELAAAQRIRAVLQDWGAGPEDMAYCQAAAGGDLLFLEACQELGVLCQVLLPFEEHEFLRQSVNPSASRSGVPDWLARWNTVKSRLKQPARIMTRELGATSASMNPFERCNVWLLNSALAHGSDKLCFLALWDGAASGDGPGGTAHLKAEAERRAARVQWIDTRALGSL